MNLSNIEIEQSVLGAIMLAYNREELRDVAMDAIEGLVADDFSVIPHRHVLQAYQRLLAAGMAVDLLTVTSDLEITGLLEQCGGFAYLAELSKNTPSAANLSHYRQMLREMGQRRALMAQLQLGIDKLNNPTGLSHSDLIASIQQSVESIDTGTDAGTQHITVGIDKALAEIDAILSGDIWKYRTQLGLPDIDKAFGGFNNTDFIVVGGRPGMGKTMFSTTATETVALHNGKPVLFFSLEMPEEQISQRIAFHRAKVSKEDLLGESNMSQDEAWARVGNCMQEFIESPIHINDKPSLSISELRAEARRMHKKLGGLGIIVVDYLQKMRMVDPENMTRSVGEIATGLKNLAKELRCPVVALAQLNRQLEQRANKRPVAADLRESGVIEQEADVILMVYRDEKYNPTTELKGITEIICVKSRHAPGAEKTYYFSNRLGGLDPVSFTPNQYGHESYDC
ncbi:replicative DNA helicase [Escherichia coli]|nr:replicative DNA helicase [Escherichia coli]